MSKRKVANHTHRYKKVNLSNTKDKPYYVYKCQKPACSHYLPVTLAEGTICECNKCFNPMLLTKAILTHSSGGPMTRPHCNDCVKRKKSDAVDAIAAFLEGNKV